MILRTMLTTTALLCLVSAVCAQVQRNEPPPVQSFDSLQNISMETSRIARAVENMNQNWRNFFQTFSSNQGLQMDERRQKLILALEVLNRWETSLSNMQKFKLDLIERQSRLRMQLATVTDDLLPQSLDRYVALRGTTDAEGLRDIRRQALNRERAELTTVLSQLQRELTSTDLEIGRTDVQIRTLRARLFGEIERELANL